MIGPPQLLVLCSACFLLGMLVYRTFLSKHDDVAWVIKQAWVSIKCPKCGYVFDKEVLYDATKDQR